MDIPVLTVRGSTYEMGLQQGRAFSEQIHAFSVSRLQRLQGFVRQYGQAEVTESEVLAICRDLLPLHAQYDSLIWEECLGIARGADIELPALLLGMGYTDIRDYVCQIKGFDFCQTGAEDEGCTAFLLPPDSVIERRVVLAQTWDMSTEAMAYLLILKRYPHEGPATVYLTTMGGLGLIGLNDRGLAVGTTNLIAQDCQPGVHYLHTISRALQAGSYADLRERILSTPRLSGHSFLITDGLQGAILETSSTHSACFELDEDPLVKTNHYSDLMRPYELMMPRVRRLNSMYRGSRALSLLCSQTVWATDRCWEILADDLRSQCGAAICNEDPTGQYAEFSTVATCLVDLNAKQLRVCRGGARTGQVQEIGF